jgi:hypothetical protein
MRPLPGDVTHNHQAWLDWNDESVGKDAWPTDPSGIVLSMSSSSSEHGASIGDTPETMLPPRQRRPPLESAFVRVVATGGVVGIGVALGAILASQHVAGWIIGLAVAVVSVLVSAVLWSSRQV